MAAFRQAQAQAQAQPPAQSSTLAVRGASRMLGSALRGAGINGEQGMEVDSGPGRRRGLTRTVSHHNRANPIDQSGRHRARDAPYAKPSADRPATLAGHELLPARQGSSSSPSGAARGARGTAPRRTNLNNSNGRRNPEGRKQHAKLTELLKSDDMRRWLQSKLVAPGVLNMSALQDDSWLKDQGILPLGDKNAPSNAGHVIWRLADKVLQEATGQPIHTLSLANNNFATLHQLSKLPLCLPHIRALDLSNNPIVSINELKALQAAGEQKGKLSLGAGSLKRLTEINLLNTKFRNDMFQRPEGGEKYKHDIMQRFPGLLILDTINLNRIIFPIEREPRVKRSDDERKALAAVPYTFPADVQPGFFENEGVASTVNQFCAKFFTTFDNDRNALLLGYAPNATVSFSANTLPSRSHQSIAISRTRSQRPAVVSFDAWVGLPARNFFRGASSIESRMATLHSPADAAELQRWLADKVPRTRHPLEDAAKWCIDSWVLDGEGASTRLCVVVVGEFQELPAGTFRSFTRTFVLTVAPPGSDAANAGWPALIASDIMTVHLYLGTASFDANRSLVTSKVSIAPPLAVATTAPPSDPAAAAFAAAAADPAKQAAIAVVRQRTGMNAPWSALCLLQNDYDVERAVANFAELRSTIPPSAYV